MTAAKGTKPLPKISAEAARAIRDEYETSRVSQAELARRHGVSKMVIGNIVAYRSHLGPDVTKIVIPVPKKNLLRLEVMASAENTTVAAFVLQAALAAEKSRRSAKE